MKFINFLLMNVLFISCVDLQNNEKQNLISATDNIEVVSFAEIENQLTNDKTATILIDGNEFTNFGDLLTYFISLVGSFLGTLLINIIKSRFPNLFVKKSKNVFIDNSNQINTKDA